MKKLIIGVALLVLAGCGGNIAAINTYKQNYSIEVVGDTSDTISVGLPDGITAANVNKSVLADVKAGLEQQGLANNGKETKIQIKSNLRYLAHKWAGLIRVKYLMTFNVQAIDNNTGKVMNSEQIDIDDTSLSEAIKKASEEIVDFAANNIK